MPNAWDRRGRLVPRDEYEEAKYQESQNRVARFVALAGGDDSVPSTRDVRMLDTGEQEWEPPEVVRSHDPHTLESARAALAEAMNSRG